MSLKKKTFIGISLSIVVTISTLLIILVLPKNQSVNAYSPSANFLNYFWTSEDSKMHLEFEVDTSKSNIKETEIQYKIWRSVGSWYGWDKPSPDKVEWKTIGSFSSGIYTYSFEVFENIGYSLALRSLDNKNNFVDTSDIVQAFDIEKIFPFRPSEFDVKIEKPIYFVTPPLEGEVTRGDINYSVKTFHSDVSIYQGWSYSSDFNDVTNWGYLTFPRNSSSQGVAQDIYFYGPTQYYYVSFFDPPLPDGSNVNRLLLDNGVFNDPNYPYW